MRAHRSQFPSRHVWILIAVIVALWAIGTYVILPRLINAIYTQQSLPSFNALLPPPVTFPLAQYQAHWNKVALGLLPILLTASLIPLCPDRGRKILLLVVLVICAAVRVPGVFRRATWDDEGISLLQTAGHPHPSWPRHPEPAGQSQLFYKGTAPLLQISDDLARTDIHPPVYFWTLALWRRALGSTIEVARTLSLIYSVATVLVLYLLLRVARVERPSLASFVIWTLELRGIRGKYRKRLRAGGSVCHFRRIVCFSCDPTGARSPGNGRVLFFRDGSLRRTRFPDALPDSLFDRRDPLVVRC